MLCLCVYTDLHSQSSSHGHIQIKQIDYIVAFIAIYIAIPYCNGYTGSQIDNTHTGNPYSSTR